MADDGNWQDIGRQLRVQRQKLGLSQAQVANLVNMNPVTVRAVERGQSTPVTVRLVASVLGMRLDEGPFTGGLTLTQVFSSPLVSSIHRDLSQDKGHFDLNVVMAALREVVQHFPGDPLPVASAQVLRGVLRPGVELTSFDREMQELFPGSEYVPDPEVSKPSKTTPETRSLAPTRSTAEGAPQATGTSQQGTNDTFAINQATEAARALVYVLEQSFPVRFKAAVAREIIEDLAAIDLVGGNDGEAPVEPGQ